MANALVQFRLDDESKTKAISICERLGMDLPTYLRICVSRLNQENGIPFPMTIELYPKNRGIEAMKTASRIAEEFGIKNMSLEEINEEIYEARKQACHEDICGD